jgi:hypothetical protein
MNKPQTGRPSRLLTNANRNLARDRIWSWSIPALAVRLPDGRTFRTCPSSGICGRFCYARAGNYARPNVRLAHLRNLLFTLEDLDGWNLAMKTEVSHPRLLGAHVRVHAAGDFYSPRYLESWLDVMHGSPAVNYYAYTKEVVMFRTLVEPDPPPNFRWIYSYGGLHDGLLDPAADRVADVFPTEADIERAGHHSQAASDLLAVWGPSPVGMAANPIPVLRKRQGQLSFREWQAREDQRRRARTHPTGKEHLP